MKTQHFLTGILAIFMLSGHVLGQWDYTGNDIYNTNSGNVGIGTDEPINDFHIKSAATISQVIETTNSSQRAELLFYENGSNMAYVQYRGTSATFPNTLRIGAIHDGGEIILIAGGPHRVKIDSDGNVGIGTMSPQSELAVNGTITAQEVEVTTSGWPDHVFADAYRLRPLDEVETYIKANQHLPDVPSASEVEEEGIALGKMQATLLQKIEELTLYVIDLQNENESLKARVASLEQEQ